MVTFHRLLFISAVGSWLMCCFLKTATCETVGTIYFKVDCYHHPSRLTRWGKFCEILISKECDPMFTFCFSKTYPTSDKCGIQKFKYEFNNRSYLGACNKRNPVNFPPKMQFALRSGTSNLYLTLTITERNRITPNRLIDEIIFRLSPGVPAYPSTQTYSDALMVPLNISTRIFTNTDQPIVKISAAIICAENRYGPLCSVECKSSSNYRCLPDGSRNCTTGWLGPLCEKRDRCQPTPCRSWAVCHNTATSFECECDGRTGPQCELTGDPCTDNRCANGASCVSQPDRPPKCVCPKGWMGMLCDLRSPCVTEPCGIGGTCEPTINRPAGNDSAVNLTFVCRCRSGYSGLRCENVIVVPTVSSVASLTTKSNIVQSTQSSIILSTGNATTVVIVILSLLILAFLVTGAVLFFRRHKKRKRRRQRGINERVEPIYRVARNIPSSVYDDPDSVYEDPDMNNPLYLYEDSGEPYSPHIEAQSTSEPSPSPPQRPTSSASSKGPRTPIRFVRA